MEDETGIANVIVTPDLYDHDRLVVHSQQIFACGGSASKPGQRDPCEGHSLGRAFLD
jgi:hypothetical protein